MVNSVARTDPFYLFDLSERDEAYRPLLTNKKRSALFSDPDCPAKLSARA